MKGKVIVDGPAAAREVNSRIKEAAESLTAPDEGDTTFDFVCECGCFELVPLTLTAYVAAGGAWRNGHEPH